MSGYETLMAESHRLRIEAEKVRTSGIRSRVDPMVESEAERTDAPTIRRQADRAFLDALTSPDRQPHVPAYSPTQPTLVTFQPSLEATYGPEGEPQRWNLYGVFETAEERDAFIARFPKSAGVRRSTLSSAEGSFPAAAAQGNLWADGVNKGVNETGLKRYRTIARIAPELPWKSTFLNAFPTRAAFEAALDR